MLSIPANPDRVQVEFTSNSSQIQSNSSGIQVKLSSGLAPAGVGFIAPTPANQLFAPSSSAGRGGRAGPDLDGLAGLGKAGRAGGAWAKLAWLAGMRSSSSSRML